MLFGFFTILSKELHGYFTAPIAYVFSAIFLFLISLLTFTIGGYFERAEADLAAPFFQWHPLLLALFAPAIGMKVWADEHRQGTLELLFSKPVSLSIVVLAKYTAALIFLLVPLGLTISIVMTTAWLGKPEYGVIFSSYFGSLLTASSFIAISCLCSAFCRTQVSAFVIAATICLVTVLIGMPKLSNEIITSFPGSKTLVESISSFGVNQHFGTFRKGVIEFHSLIYFLLITLSCLFLNYLVISRKQR